MKHKELEVQKQSMVEAYHNSGMTAAKWCIENNVKLSNLRYWLSKISRHEAFTHIETGFVQFSSVADEATAITVYVGDVRLELNPGFNVRVFQEAVRVLRSL